MRRLGRLPVLVLTRRQRLSRGAARSIEALGFLPWSNAVHYEDEPGRRAAFHDAVAGGMPPGYGAGDGAALHFVGTELAEVVSSRCSARSVHLSHDGAGGVRERELPVRYLGASRTSLTGELGASLAGEAIAA